MSVRINFTETFEKLKYTEKTKAIGEAFLSTTLRKQANINVVCDMNNMLSTIHSGE